FFLLGPFAAGAPDLVRRMVAAGHELGNHTWSHRQAPGMSAAQLWQEIEACENTIRDITGFSSSPWFRFPYGDRSDANLQAVNAAGYMSVYWTIDPQDWRGMDGESLASLVLAEVRPGAIILMHGINPEQKATALPIIIGQLRARGYEPVTLTELFLVE
ncbi:MAG: polysaccharide deacetylase family protein, partial [Candidatus Geothermincolia bacterium]